LHAKSVAGDAKAVTLALFQGPQIRK
jgi:hypothetical protein